MHRGGGWNVERGRGGLEKADEGEGGRGGGEFVGDWIEFSSILIRSLVGWGDWIGNTASSLVLSLLEPS